MKDGKMPNHYFSEGKIRRLNHLYDTKEMREKKGGDNSFFSLFFWGKAPTVGCVW
jgi:hypothetical protein